MGTSISRRAAPWPYEPLKGTEIRLIKFDTQLVPEGHISCKLEHFEIKKDLEFQAMSWVWGDPKVFEYITLNGEKFGVSQNLYNGLKQFQKTGILSWFWIDAICINQRDLAEKTRQIPRMNEIYSSASYIACWMGAEEIPGIELVSQVTHKFLDVSFEESDAFDLQKLLGEDFRQFLTAFRDFLRNKWFIRIWTAQEYALNGYAFVLLGTKGHAVWFGYSNLVKILRSLLNVEKSGYDALVMSYYMPTFNVRILGLESLSECRDKDWTTMTFAEQLLKALKNSRIRLASLPHDYIYGLLGMCSTENIPNSLLPDYTISFGQVFQDYSRHILEYTGDLRILDCNHNGLDDFPSWVPDFRANVLAYSEPKTKNVARFSSDGGMVTLQGVRMGNLIAHSIRGQEDRLLHIQEAILTISSRIRQMTLEAILQEWLEVRMGSVKLTDDQTYAELFRSMDDVLAMLPQQLEQDQISEQWPQWFGHVMKGITMEDFLVLENGDIANGRLHSPPTSTDQIVALKGAYNLLIIRPSASVQGAFKLVGWCRHWSKTLTLDEEFFSRGNLEYIDLV